MSVLFLNTIEWNTFWQACGWTLLHSLWIGLFAAAIAALVIICTRKSSARLRYNALGLTFILFVTGTIVAFISEYLSGQTSLGPTQVANLQSATDPSLTSISNNPGDKTEFSIWFNKYASEIVLVWALFFIFHLLKIVTGLFSVNRLRHYRIHQVDEDWHVKLRELANKIGVSKSVQLLQSELVKVPVVIGYFKPVILLPLGLLTHLPPQQAYAILLHELAHIRRGDYLINVLQRLTEAVFFFNPAIIWISGLIRQEREACCDDLVLANTNNKKNYLEALVSFQEYSMGFNSYALGISNRKQFLLQRVSRMLTQKNQSINYREVSLLILGFITLTAFNILSQPGLKTVINTETSLSSIQGLNYTSPSGNNHSISTALAQNANVVASPASTETYDRLAYANTKGIVLENNFHFRIPQDTPKITIQKKEFQVRQNENANKQFLIQQRNEQKIQKQKNKEIKLENKQEEIHEKNEKAEKRIAQDKAEQHRLNQERARDQQERIRQQKERIQEQKKHIQKIEENKRTRKATVGNSSNNTNQSKVNNNSNKAVKNETNLNKNEDNIRKNPSSGKDPKPAEKKLDSKLDEKIEQQDESHLDWQNEKEIWNTNSKEVSKTNFTIKHDLRYTLNNKFNSARKFELNDKRVEVPRAPTSQPPKINPSQPKAPAPKKIVI